MTEPHFNPETVVLEIPFTAKLQDAKSNNSFVRFGPVSVEQVTFDIQSVSDTRTGRAYPVDAFRLNVAGPDGDQHMLVSLEFNGGTFNEGFRAETAPEAYLARLKAGLTEVLKVVSCEDDIKHASLEKVQTAYNIASEALVGAYEPLFAAFSTGTILAVTASVQELASEGGPLPEVTLLLQPRIV
jgi:hypothetical protein